MNVKDVLSYQPKTPTTPRNLAPSKSSTVTNRSKESGVLKRHIQSSGPSNTPVRTPIRTPSHVIPPGTPGKVAYLGLDDVDNYSVNDTGSVMGDEPEEVIPIKPVPVHARELEHQQILAALKDPSASDVGILAAKSADSTAMNEMEFKRCLLQFEKKALRNQEMRIKFPSQPERFMDSEVELHSQIEEMAILATAPKHYQCIVELKCVDSLLQLLSHENSDISLAVIELLQEMTDPDVVQEEQEAVGSFINALISAQLVPMLVLNLARLDENVKEEFDGVHNTLGVIENLTEACPDARVSMASGVSSSATSSLLVSGGKPQGSSSVGLMSWLLKRLQLKAFDANKLYVAEILAILLQDDDENRELLGELSGVDILLQELAVFKRHNPSSTEEYEMMENLFSCLCSALLHKNNRDRFLKGEGLQLMNLLLKEKKMSRNSAIKVLDYALQCPYGAELCSKFVDILGLRTLFPLFMKPPKRAKDPNNAVKGPGKEQLEEHIVSCVCSLIRNCGPTQKSRAMNKFVENDYEKVERLVELHFKYSAQVERADTRIQHSKANADLWTANTPEELQEEIYMKRLEGGLFCLQMIDMILLEICVNGTVGIRQRAKQMLNIRGGSLAQAINVVKEFADNMEDHVENNIENKDKTRLLTLLESAVGLR